jgi:hypothetical protein
MHSRPANLVHTWERLADHATPWIGAEEKKPRRVRAGLGGYAELRINRAGCYPVPAM